MKIDSKEQELLQETADEYGLSYRLALSILDLQIENANLDRREKLIARIRKSIAEYVSENFEELYEKYKEEHYDTSVSGY